MGGGCDDVVAVVVGDHGHGVHYDPHHPHPLGKGQNGDPNQNGVPSPLLYRLTPDFPYSYCLAGCHWHCCYYNWCLQLWETVQQLWLLLLRLCRSWIDFNHQIQPVYRLYTPLRWRFYHYPTHKYIAQLYSTIAQAVSYVQL